VKRKHLPFFPHREAKTYNWKNLAFLFNFCAVCL
jgi:hypothetical protein